MGIEQIMQALQANPQMLMQLVQMLIQAGICAPGAKMQGAGGGGMPPGGPAGGMQPGGGPPGMAGGPGAGRGQMGGGRPAGLMR